MLAKRSGARIVPTAVIGTHSMLPRGAKGVKRGHIKIVFGEPFTYEAVTDGSTQTGREAFTSELQRRLLHVCLDHGLTLTQPNE
jgi:1-acyl-sn-glycerol-3-phosphate acyltransferase